MEGLGGVILAAGESSRMGRDKALLPWPPGSRGTLVCAAIDALSQHCDMVLVVGGNNTASLKTVVYGCGGDLVCNPAPERGQFSSLQTGLQEVLNRGRDSAMVTLVDRPPPQADTLSRLVNAFAKRAHGIWCVAPEFQGKHGHPILIGREMIEIFLKSPVGANAREIEHVHQNRILHLRTDDPLVTTNVDTPQDYASLESKP